MERQKTITLLDNANKDCAYFLSSYISATKESNCSAWPSKPFWLMKYNLHFFRFMATVTWPEIWLEILILQNSVRFFSSVRHDMITTSVLLNKGHGKKSLSLSSLCMKKQCKMRIFNWQNYFHLCLKKRRLKGAEGDWWVPYPMYHTFRMCFRDLQKALPLFTKKTRSVIQRLLKHPLSLRTQNGL